MFAKKGGGLELLGAQTLIRLMLLFCYVHLLGWELCSFFLLKWWPTHCPEVIRRKVLEDCVLEGLENKVKKEENHGKLVGAWDTCRN